MSAAVWFTVVGLLLVGVALAISTIQRLPLTTALLYLGVGWLLGPEVVGLVAVDPLQDSALLEHLSEIVVIVSLFSVGLKLRVPIRDPRWRTAFVLAFGSMTLTVALVTIAGVYLLGLPVGGAVLLGAILAPTDPVLASDVQVGDPFDRDPLRFSLTGEAGLNDGTAFPFVMLGLGLLGLHEIGEGWWRWWAVDVLWAVTAGLGIGTLLGTAVGQLVLYLRRSRREAVGSDDFIAIGLIALSYGVALLCHAYGFLAVFAAGLALRGLEMRHSAGRAPEAVKRAAESSLTAPDESATHPEQAPAYMTEAVRHVTEQLERIGEIVIVLIVGALLGPGTTSLQALGFSAVLLMIIRPVAVMAGLMGQGQSRLERGLLAWFGIRGIGSIYYLMFAIGHGLPDDLARQLITLVVTTVAVSTVVHGASVTALMARYARVTQSPKAPAG
jgi:NhaP-type Na+/H+ or K+/H+ antiporter